MAQLGQSARLGAVRPQVRILLPRLSKGITSITGSYAFFRLSPANGIKKRKTR